MKVKVSNRILAREILVLFSSIILVGISFGIIVLWNEYNSHGINNLSSKIEKLNSENSMLPTNYDWELYQKMGDKFIDGYKLKEDTFYFRHTLLNKFLENHPNAIPVSMPPIKLVDLMGCNFKIFDGSLSFDTSKVNWSKIDGLTDSKLVTDPTIIAFYYKLSKEFGHPIIGCFYISFDEFQKCLKNGEYQNWVSLILDIHTTKAEIDKGVGYDPNVENQRKVIEGQIMKYAFQIDESKGRLLDGEEQKSYIINIIFIILFIVYPIRFSIVSILWALKTIRIIEVKEK